MKFFEWRLAAQGDVDAVMVPEFAARAPAVKVVFPSTPSGRQSLNDEAERVPCGKAPNIAPAVKDTPTRKKAGKIDMTKHEIYMPLVPFIPPYVGISANRISISIFPVKKNGDVRILLECMSRKPQGGRGKILSKHIVLNELSEQKWNDITLEIDTDMASRLAEVYLRVIENDPTSTCEFYFANPRVIYQDNQIYEIFNNQAPSLLQGMKQPLVSKVAKHLPQREQIHIGFGNNWGILKDAENFQEISAFFKRYFPEFDIVLSCSHTPEPELARVLPLLPDNLFYQFQKAQHGLAWLALNDELPRDWRGKPQTRRFNSILATSTILQDALKEQMDYAATLGINNFKSYDYVWPYLEGRWGYDAPTVNAFRRDLAHQDGGLALISEITGQTETFHFWDYFQDIHGMTFMPEDLGLKSWKDFFPTTEKDMATTKDIKLLRNYSVFLVLCHYEWLLQAQRFNDWAKAHGGTYDHVLNGETWSNGNDLLTLIRLKDSGIIAPEFFIRYPEKMESCFRGHDRHLRCARRLGKQMGICLEVSTGGGGGHPYLDLRTGYAISYALRATGFTNFHHDHQDTWKSKVPHAKTAFNLCMSEASAFRRAKLDKARKIGAPEVLQLIVRPVGVKIDSFLTNQNLRQSNQQDFWDPALIDNQINYEQTDSTELPLMLDKARVIFYAPPVSRKDTAQLLEKWLAQGNKTLVTHTYIPFSHDHGRADFDVLLQEPEQRQGTPLFKGFENGKPVGQTILLDSQQKPLLTIIPRGNGSNIYYLHISPKNGPQHELRKTMAFLTRELRLPLVQQPDKFDNAIPLRFRNQDSMITVLWNKELRDQASARCQEWNRTIWQGKRRYFNPDNYLFKYKQPGAACSATITVDKPGNYRIYRFLEDRETVVKVGMDNLLKLPLNNALVDIFYSAPDTQEFRRQLADIKENRQLISPFLVEQPRWDGVPQTK